MYDLRYPWSRDIVGRRQLSITQGTHRMRVNLRDQNWNVLHDEVLIHLDSLYKKYKTLVVTLLVDDFD